MRGADGVWKMWYFGRDASFDQEINLPHRPLRFGDLR